MSAEVGNELCPCGAECNCESCKCNVKDGAKPGCKNASCACGDVCGCGDDCNCKKAAAACGKANCNCDNCPGDSCGCV